jgi:hypothetical protein
MIRPLLLALLVASAAHAETHGGKAFGLTVETADGYGWTHQEIGDPKSPTLVLTKDDGQKVIFLQRSDEPFEKEATLKKFVTGIATTRPGLKGAPAADYEFQGKTVESQDLRHEKDGGDTVAFTVVVVPVDGKTLIITMRSAIVDPRANDEFRTILRTIKLL